MAGRFQDDRRRRAEAAFFCDNAGDVERVYGAGRRQQIEALTPCYGPIVSAADFELQATELGEVKAVFSTWGMPILTPDQLARLPRLEAVFFAAGSVQGFARPYLERGIAVFSAWAANAVPVAEFTLAQILLANKGYFRNTREARAHVPEASAFIGAGNFETTVALLGAGQIGRKLIELLRAFALHVIVFDPFLTGAEASRLGVEKVSLTEAFQRGNVVSNHLAHLPETIGLLQGAHFASMPEHAAFINTGRPATVKESELFEVLSRRSDLTALLDVIMPGDELPFDRLPNVQLTTHIAGSKNAEVLRLADLMIEEYKSWREGRPTRCSVTLRMLETMA